jgi:hypothetical protein
VTRGAVWKRQATSLAADTGGPRRQGTRGMKEASSFTLPTPAAGHCRHTVRSSNLRCSARTRRYPSPFQISSKVWRGSR